MKTIRVIIAFLSVYLFVSALLIIIFFGVWLARYYPDSSQQEMAQITVSALSKDLSKNRFTILNQSKGTTCLVNTITRASNSPSELRPLLVADTKTVSISYKRFNKNISLCMNRNGGIGTPLMWSPYENTTLREVYIQMINYNY